MASLLEYVSRPDGTERAAACPKSGSDSDVLVDGDVGSSSWSVASAGMPVPEESSWYAIRVRARWEKLVADALRNKEYDEFLPLYRKRSNWSDRIKEITLPLFPGYVFCRSDLSGRTPFITTPGVIGILSFAGCPAIISDKEIEVIKAIVHSGADVGPWPYVHQGRRVRMHCGPLAGVEGILIRAKGDWRVVLSVETLCRSVAVEVDREWVSPIS
jgi:transcription antitermination factor NusG